MDWYSIQNRAGDAAATVEIFGNIGSDAGDAVSASAFISKFNAIPNGRPIDLVIDSAGGSVFEGLSIYDCIAARSGDVTARVTSLAASMASVVICAAGKIVMAPGAMLLLHSPFSNQGGNANELARRAAMLATLETRLVGIYCARTGKSEGEIRDALAQEKLFTAQEAKAFGLCDAIEPMAGYRGQLFGSLRAASGDVLDHLRAELSKEADPLKKVEMARRLRLLRGHGNLFSPNDRGDFPTPESSGKNLEQLRAQFESAAPDEKIAIRRQIRAMENGGVDPLAARHISKKNGLQSRTLRR